MTASEQPFYAVGVYFAEQAYQNTIALTTLLFLPPLCHKSAALFDFHTA